MVSDKTDTEVDLRNLRVSVIVSVILHYDSNWNIPFLRQQLGYVPQDVFLFSDTLKNNIAWGKPEATNAQIIQAAQLAAIYVLACYNYCGGSF